MSKQTRKALTPTKNPFLSSNSNAKGNPNTSNNYPEKMCRKVKSLHDVQEKILKRLSCTQKLGCSYQQNETKNKRNLQDDIQINESSFSQINSKIEDILKNLDYSKKQKIRKQNKKQSKQIQKEKTKISNRNSQQKSQIQNEFQEIERKSQNKEPFRKFDNQNRKKCLQDITIHHINYPNNLTSQDINLISKKKAINTRDISFLQLPKLPKATSSKKIQVNIKAIHNKPNIQTDVFNFNPSPITLSNQLEELQTSEDNINSILSNLQRDFLPPKNTDYFVFNEQEIKIPKIFRKSKANNQMYKSCTQNKAQSKDICLQSYKSVLVEKTTVRKSQPAQHYSIIQRQMQNFLMGLKTQIYLDSQFKKIKRWFLYSKNENKWKLLQKQLRENKLWVNQLTMKVIFMHDQQGNLFQSVDDEQFSIKQLVFSFIAAQQHWNEYILQKFDNKLLQGAGLNQNVLDSSKKGFISIEDLIRFLHCKLKEFYYTRDLNMVYLRLKGGQKLQFQQLISKISKNDL